MATMILGGRAVPVLTDRSIRECVTEGILTIDPFDESQLGSTYYALRAAELITYEWRGARSASVEKNLRITSDGVVLRPRTHVVIAICENIVLPPGMVGTMFPVSTWVKRGVMFTMGRRDAREESAIVIGAFNATDEPFRLTSTDHVAHISFTWLGHPQQTPVTTRYRSEHNAGEIEFSRLLVGGDEWIRDDHLGPRDDQEV